jgi:ribosomal protein S18 acetylase RimI-like enzyme
MPSTEWSLRPATQPDRDFLLDLNRAAFRESVEPTWGWDDDEQRAYFDARFEPSRREVVQVAGVDIGEVVIEDRATEIYLARIALLPDWQGRGIGTSIVLAVLERAAATGRAVVLEVLHTNPRAARLYEELGFTRTGENATHVFMRREPGKRHS